MSWPRQQSQDALPASLKTKAELRAAQRTHSHSQAARLPCSGGHASARAVAQHLLQCEQARRGHNARLAHAASQHLAQPPRARYEARGARQD